MRKSLFLAIGLVLLGAVGPASADQAAPNDWTAGGRWLTPYTMPGYDGYGFVLPSATQAAQSH
jgi:hypothetical protein